MPTVTIKRGDRAFRFTDTLRVNGTALNLTGWTVLFLYRDAAGTAYSRPATVDTPAAGAVSYEPTAEDFTTAGPYAQEWEATNADGKKLTFPNDDTNLIRVAGDIA